MVMGKVFKRALTLGVALSLSVSIAVPQGAMAFDDDDVYDNGDGVYSWVDTANALILAIIQANMPTPQPAPAPRNQTQTPSEPPPKTFCDNQRRSGDIYCANNILPIEHWYDFQHKPVTVEPEEAKTATPVSDTARIRSNAIATIIVNGRKYADVTIDEYEAGKYKDTKNVLLDVYAGTSVYFFNPDRFDYTGIVRDRYGEGAKPWEESLKGAEAYIEKNLGYPYNIYDKENLINFANDSTYAPTALQSAVASAYKGVQQTAPEVIEELKHQFDDNPAGKESTKNYGSKLEAPRVARADKIIRDLSDAKYNATAAATHRQVGGILQRYLGKLPEDIYFQNLDNLTWDEFQTRADGGTGWVENGLAQLDLQWLIAKPWYIDEYPVNPADPYAKGILNTGGGGHGHSLMRFMPILGVPVDDEHRYNVLQMFDITSSKEFSKDNLPPDFMNLPDNAVDGYYQGLNDRNKVTTRPYMGGVSGLCYSEIELTGKEFLLPYLDYEAINAGMEGWQTRSVGGFPDLFFYQWEYEGAQPNKIILREIIDPSLDIRQPTLTREFREPNYPHYTGRVIYLTRANDTAS